MVLCYGSHSKQTQALRKFEAYVCQALSNICIDQFGTIGKITVKLPLKTQTLLSHPLSLLLSLFLWVIYFDHLLSYSKA